MCTHEFRRAKSVELYDVGTKIVLHSVHDESGFIEFGTIPVITLEGEEFCQLLRHFGIEYKKTSKAYTDEITMLEDEKFTFGRQVSYYEGNWEKIQILVRVVAPNMLDIYVTSRDKAGHEWTRQHTYCGSFAVEWDD